MINPALIRGKIPLLLFVYLPLLLGPDKELRRHQRGIIKIHVGSIFVVSLIKENPINRRSTALIFVITDAVCPQPRSRAQHKRFPVEMIDKRLAFPALQRRLFPNKGPFRKASISTQIFHRFSCTATNLSSNIGEIDPMKPMDNVEKSRLW